MDAFGGWRSRKMVDAYLRYAEVCFTHFKIRVKLWTIVNEQLIATAAGMLNGNHEPEDAAALQTPKPDFISINYYFSLCVKAKTGPINYDRSPFRASDAFDICENPHLEKRNGWTKTSTRRDFISGYASCTTATTYR